MKQIKPSSTFVKEHSDWLVELASGELLSTMLNLVESAGIYIVDKSQKVLYWSPGARDLTGIPQSEAIGKACLKDFEIVISMSDIEKTLELPQANGNIVKLKLNSQILHDSVGRIAGGIGLITLASESKYQVSQPKMPGTSMNNFHGIISRSPAMKDVFRIIQNAAQTEATVLVRGESGSGKELVANAIHNLSARCDAPFLAVNCAALSSNLLESELFGHVRGAFTGAIKDHDGLFKRANGGTLFLDEVAEMPLELQAKLLRVIQERNYVPVGGSHSIDVDVRLVAATHRSLREEARLGNFREDLMYRLRVVPIFLPPLRERREDINLLLWHFIQLHNDKRVRVIEKIDPDAMKVLLDYPWPGNVRELHNVVEYAFAVGRGSVLRLSELPLEFREPRIAEHQRRDPKKNLPLHPDNEASAILKALEQSNGQVSVAADLLSMSRATFWRKRKHYGI